MTQTWRRYWRINLGLIAALLLVWLLATFGVAYFARELSFKFAGWPFSFWMASQGALLLYLLVVAVYARVMNRLDAGLLSEGGEHERA